MKQYAIDRLEGRVAVCEDEDGKLSEIPRASLPEDAKEGDVLAFCDGHYVIDRQSTERRRLKNAGLQKKLWK